MRGLFHGVCRDGHWLAAPNAALERLATASYNLAAVCALSGDETGMWAAREMCGDAQLSSSQITVLDALTKYTQGHFTEAYGICHAAMQQGTLDFTARAVLAITCILAGHDDQYPSVLAELRKLETDELDDNERPLDGGCHGLQ